MKVGILLCAALMVQPISAGSGDKNIPEDTPVLGVGKPMQPLRPGPSTSTYPIAPVPDARPTLSSAG